MKIRYLDEIRKAKRISFSITIIDKTEIVIDKVLGKVYRNGDDATELCFEMLNAVWESGNDTPSNCCGGVLFARILKNEIDEGCKHFLNDVADDLVLE